MAIDLDTSLLRNFLVSARLGSLSRAASALGRTQPALSQQLRRLEDIFGDALLERSVSGVALTSAGAALLPYAERILALAEEALACSSRPKVSGRCSVGVLEDFTGTALPAVFADFAQIHPSTTLELISLANEDTQLALDEGRIQLALCDVGFVKHQVKWSTHMPLFWVSGGEFDLAVDPLPLVLFSEPCSWRNVVQATLSAAGRRSRIAFQSDSLTAVQAAIRAGLGVTALLPTALAPGVFNVSRSNALPKLPEVEIGLFRRGDSEGNMLVNLVEDMLKQLVRPSS